MRSDAPVSRLWGLEPRELAILAAILLATALVYLPSLRYGWVWDDKCPNRGATALHSWSGVAKSFIYDSWWFRDPTILPQSAYYRPFQAAWFGLNYLILGLHPAAWHLEKIVLELIAVILCFRLAQLLTNNTTIALLTAAIFGLMPANVESVVWNSAIGEPLSTIFEMGAMCFFIQRRPGFSRQLIFALMCYAGALLSHETAILFWLIVAAYLFEIEKKTLGESLKLAGPFLLLAFLYLVRTSQCSSGGITCSRGRISSGRALPSDGKSRISHMDRSTSILTLPSVLLTYLADLAIPGIAAPAHSTVWVTSLSPTTFDVRRHTRAACGRCFHAGPQQSGSPHLSFLRSVGAYRDSARNEPQGTGDAGRGPRPLFAVVCVEPRAGGDRNSDCVAAARAPARLICGAIALLLLANAVAIARLERYWHDNVTFLSEVVLRTNYDAEYLSGLVDVLNYSGHPDQALEVILKAVANDPDNIYLHSKLAGQYGMMQRSDEFVAEISKVRELRAAASRARRAHRAANPAPHEMKSSTSFARSSEDAAAPAVFWNLNARQAAILAGILLRDLRDLHAEPAQRLGARRLGDPGRQQVHT